MKFALALAVAFVAIAPIAASAHSQEEQEACMNDAFQFCGDYIPDRGRVAACLAAKKAQISPACRGVMARYPAPGTTAQVTPAPSSKAIPNKTAPGKPLKLTPSVVR